MRKIKRQLVDMQVVAYRLRISIGWLKTEADAGKIPHIKAEGTYHFDLNAVEKVLLDRAANEEGQPHA